MKVIFIEHQLNHVQLLDPNSVLACDAASQLDTAAKNLLPCLDHFVYRARNPLVKTEDGVKVAIARVKDVANLDPCLFSDMGGVLQHVWKLTAGDDTIVSDDGGGKASQGADPFLACGPELGSFCLVLSQSDLVGAFGPADGHGLLNLSEG